MKHYSSYINDLLKTCTLLDFDDFEIYSNEPEYMANYFATNDGINITNLSLVGLESIDFNELLKIDSLQYLKLSDCNIVEIPNDIDKLSSLHTLDLSSNNIEFIPDGLFNLKSLDQLRLSYNKISNLSYKLGDLDNLVWCYFDNNKIKSLPASISKLESLDKLVLSNNMITDLPCEIGKLKLLVELYLDNNLISSLPESMLSMSAIDRLSLDKNKFTFDLSEIYGFEAIDKINYVINICNDKTTDLNEFKLLVVGDERVGKTSIINRINNDGFSDACESTQGIDIKSGLIIDKYKVNVWDFAGQEITHQTHQFFLSKRSLYFLVLDAQKEDDSLSIFNWLSTIKTYGGNDSPIIIVINKIDLNRGYVFDYELYKKNFNIKDVVYSSAKDGLYHKFNGIKRVSFKWNDIILEQTKYINGLDLKIPQSWLDVKEYLKSESYSKKDIIQYDEFDIICSKFDINESKDKTTLLALLNQIGTIVAYHDDDRLNILQIINPTWLTNSVYKIIRSENILSDGILDYNSIREIFLSDSSYKSYHFRWLMDLLILFKLAFEIKKDRLLLPARLNNSQPEFDLSYYKKGFCVRFDYTSFLKRNILSQLIVKLHYMIDKDSNKYWKRGVFLRYKSSKAVIILDEFEKNIDIYISGECPSSLELKSIITSEIKMINSERYEVEELIAIKDGNEIISYEDYDFLLDLLENNETETHIKVRDKITKKTKSKKVNIKELIYGIKKTVDNFDFDNFTLKLKSKLIIISESRRVVFKENENLITTRLRDLLFGGEYSVADQSLGGESFSGKSEGERDIVIRDDNGESKTIIESLCLSYVDKGEIDKHINKLISNYDTSGHKKNYIVVYAKSKSFDDFFYNYECYISLRCDICAHLDELTKDSKNIKILESIHNQRTVIHILADLYSPQIN